jgi:hypothetical protein
MKTMNYWELMGVVSLIRVIVDQFTKLVNEPISSEELNRSQPYAQVNDDDDAVRIEVGTLR